MNYQFECEYYEYQNAVNKYRIKIYPDCFMTTNNTKLLTKFEIWNEESQTWIKKKKTKDPFDKIFQLAWDYFNEKNKIKNQIKT